jgi:hypothetical protein
VACRECGRTSSRGAGSIRTNGPAFCLLCLAQHPEATFADRLTAHRLAAGLTLMTLAERVGSPHQRVCDYERGRSAPQWGTLVGLVEGLGAGPVDGC